VNVRTTHTGSLPRPESLQRLMADVQDGVAIDTGLFAREVRSAVAEVVQRQIEIGIDLVDDGEQSKLGFVSYVNERLGGFTPSANFVNPFPGSREHRAFPEFYAAQRGSAGSFPGHLTCTGPVRYTGAALVQRDIANLRAALGERDPATAFIPAASPASVEGWQQNAYYANAETYLFAIADAMREEYRAIVDAGFTLQVDDPWLAMHYMLDPEADVRSTYAWAEPRIAALNRALAGIPEQRVRYHTCYGINMGPRTTEIEMKALVPLLLRINAGGYSFEFGNPRHEHEWTIWRDVALPEEKVLIPGVISHTTVLVEHPEVVAQRIRRFAGIVGPDRVIAGSDCGFASNPRSVPEVHPTIVWAKLRALVEGARLASV
jgi:5-methyltetrahydropteroyltriglutamate--homocysteine methyltransferase